MRKMLTHLIAPQVGLQGDSQGGAQAIELDSDCLGGG